MPKPTREEAIRAYESIKQSITQIGEIAKLLISQGHHEEARTLDTALEELSKSLARIKVCEEGKVNVVH